MIMHDALNASSSSTPADEGVKIGLSFKQRRLLFETSLARFQQTIKDVERMRQTFPKK